MGRTLGFLFLLLCPCPLPTPFRLAAPEGWPSFLALEWHVFKGLESRAQWKAAGKPSIQR